jgi:hypothetical protein
MQQRVSLGWSGVAIATVLMMLCSGLILYPIATDANILTSLRVSSVTTALPFLLVFTAKPLARLNVGGGIGVWIRGCGETHSVLQFACACIIFSRRFCSWNGSVV